MRTYGRITIASGRKIWVEVQTDVDGFDDYVWITTLCQCLLLNLGESPFYAQYGIPAEQSVLQQMFPDASVVRTQTQFAQYFAALLVTKQQGSSPSYLINVTTRLGVRASLSIPY
jgi:hypothetical protein